MDMQCFARFIGRCSIIAFASMAANDVSAQEQDGAPLNYGITNHVAPPIVSIHFPKLNYFPIPENCDCKKELDALVDGEKKLSKFFENHPEYEQAARQKEAADKAAELKDAKAKLSGPQKAYEDAKNPKGKTKGEVSPEIQKNYDDANNLVQTAQHDNDSANLGLKLFKNKHPKPLGPAKGADDDLKSLLKNVQNAIDALENCIKACQLKGQWAKPPKFPTGCTNRGYLLALKKQAQEQIFIDSPYKAEWEDLLQKIQAALDALGMLQGCPGKFIFERPQGTSTYAVTFSGDSTQQCTFADGNGVSAPVEFADDEGNSIPDGAVPVGAPVSPRTMPVTPPTPDQPVATPETPARTTETPPPGRTLDTPPARTAETPPPGRTPATPTPRTPDTTPTQTTDVPPMTPTSDDIPSTVFVKANQEVVQGGPTGQPVGSQTVKLLAERPALPGSGDSKTAQDTGFDKPPAQCTTGADGRCKFEVPATERPVYGLPVTAGRRPNYRIEFNSLKSSGGVAEITGRRPAAQTAPVEGNVGSEIFTIGNRVFQRFGFNTPYESREDAERSYRAALGDRYQVDVCETKKPGPPLGIEPTSLNEPSHELSQAKIKLDRTARSVRTSR